MLRKLALTTAALSAPGIALTVASERLIRPHLFYRGEWHPEPPEAVGRPHEEATLYTADGLELQGWWFPAEPRDGALAPTLLFFHGTSYNASDMWVSDERALAFHDFLRDTRCSFFVFDYRGYGRNRGVTTEEGTYTDGAAALAWLLSRDDVDPATIFFYGFSLGSGIATEMAAREPSAGLILRAPFTSLRDMIIDWDTPPARTAVHRPVAAADEVRQPREGPPPRPAAARHARRRRQDRAGVDGPPHLRRSAGTQAIRLVPWRRAFGDLERVRRARHLAVRRRCAPDACRRGPDGIRRAAASRRAWIIATPSRYSVAVAIDIQQQLAERVHEAIGPKRGFLDRDPEYRALKQLAQRNKKYPPRTPHDALQHVVDVARDMTHGTFGALAVTSATDYVEGFIVSGMDDRALAALKGPPQGHGPLGNMRQDGLSVHMADVSEHEKAFGFPPKHPPMKELLGVPIFCGAEIRGALYVTDRKGGRPFGAEEKVVLEVLARHAALIIDASWY